MRWGILSLVVIFTTSIGFYFFYPRTSTEILNPVVEVGRVPDIAGAETAVEEDFAVSCILSYGTFFVSQNACDELTAYDNGEKSETPTSCTVSAGTFLVSQKECEILSRAQGSRDIMEQLD